MIQRRVMEGSRMLGLIDSLGNFVRPRPSVMYDPARALDRFSAIESEFETMLAAVSKRIGSQRIIAPRAEPAPIAAPKSDEERRRRKETAHRAMRADIEAKHASLRTALTPADLDDIVAFLQQLNDVVRSGRDSLMVIPRVRCAVTQRLRAEAGAIALDRLLARLRRKGLSWPHPAWYYPGASHGDIEASKQRRMSDVRTAFVGYGLERIAERAQGIVRGWGGDYPDRGSLLWRESVLVGVAAATWGRLLQHFVELVRQDGDLLLSRIEESVGERLPRLHAVLDGGLASVPEAQEVFAASLRILDVMIPEIAWQLVKARLPRVHLESRAEASVACS
jgi:hypothetical protein